MKNASTPAQESNPLFEGLKHLVREAVREELQTLAAANNKPEKLLLDTAEAAAMIGLPETWLATAAREGKIKSVKLGHYVRFARTDLEEFILKAKAAGELNP